MSASRASRTTTAERSTTQAPCRYPARADHAISLPDAAAQAKRTAAAARPSQQRDRVARRSRYTPAICRQRSRKLRAALVVLALQLGERIVGEARQTQI